MCVLVVQGSTTVHRLNNYAIASCAEFRVARINKQTSQTLDCTDVVYETCQKVSCITNPTNFNSEESADQEVMSEVKGSGV